MPTKESTVRIISPSVLPDFLNEENGDDYALLTVGGSQQDIDQFQPHLERLINKHCIYIVCAGKMAENMFDATQETITNLELDGKIPETSDMISTVWYDHDTPDEIVSGFLKLSSPETSLYLIALLGSDPLSQMLKTRLC